MLGPCSPSAAESRAEVLLAEAEEAHKLEKKEKKRDKELKKNGVAGLPGMHAKDHHHKKHADSKKTAPKDAAAAATAGEGDDGSLVSFSIPAEGTRVLLVLRNKELNGLEGTVTAADVANFLFTVTTTDGRVVKKVGLGHMAFPPAVGTRVRTRNLKDDLTDLEGVVMSKDEWQCIVAVSSSAANGAQAGKTLRRLKFENLLVLPPVGARVMTRGLKKESNGKAGTVTAVDEAAWTVSVLLESGEKMARLPPGKLELHRGPLI